MKKKIIYLILSIVFFIIGLLIIQSKSNFIRGFVGDVLVVGFMYSSIKVLFNFKEKPLTIGVLSFSFFVEILQYFKLINLLNLEKSRLAILILGSKFDKMDLLAYTIGALMIYLIDTNLIMERINNGN